MLEYLGICMICLIVINFLINMIPICHGVKHQIKKCKYSYKVKQNKKVYNKKREQELCRLQERTPEQTAYNSNLEQRFQLAEKNNQKISAICGLFGELSVTDEVIAKEAQKCYDMETRLDTDYEEESPVPEVLAPALAQVSEEEEKLDSISQNTSESEQIRVDEALVITYMEADNLANDKLINDYEQEQPAKCVMQEGDDTDSLWKTSQRSERNQNIKLGEVESKLDISDDDTDSLWKTSHNSPRVQNIKLGEVNKVPHVKGDDPKNLKKSHHIMKIEDIDAWLKNKVPDVKQLSNEKVKDKDTNSAPKKKKRGKKKKKDKTADPQVADERLENESMRDMVEPVLSKWIFWKINELEEQIERNEVKMKEKYPNAPQQEIEML